MSEISIVKRGITKMHTDAIVNAANSSLLAGGGVCGDIFAEAGHEQLQAACDEIGHCDTGHAVATPAFALPVKCIIHAVGPVWHGGTQGEAEQLASCYEQSLELAKEFGCKSIAFPLISSGIYKYPKEEAWDVALSTCRRWIDSHDEYPIDIVFCVISQKSLELGEEALNRLEISGEHLPKRHALRDAVYGAAVGDALGVPFEFKQRDTFECTGMEGFGTHHMPAGTFSDDTSMMLATCDSIRERGKIDTGDMRKRFENWYRKGEYTADGTCFDIGNTTSRALDEGKGRAGERDNGNGSLMRIAPLAYTSATNPEICLVSAITHAHPTSMDACVCFVEILRNTMGGNDLRDAIHYSKPDTEEFDFLNTVTEESREDIRSGGYVLDTLGAALWCFFNTDNYADCVLAAVNLGGDTDTTACVAGALAGAAYGYDSIPEEWIETLRGKDIIESCLF